MDGPQTLNVFEHKVRVDLTKFIKKHTFNFDCVADDDCTNEDLYNRIAKPLLDVSFAGGVATCFAYGVLLKCWSPPPLWKAYGDCK